jgi:RNA polymerase sigma-70 factor (ECF subfamily)
MKIDPSEIRFMVRIATQRTGTAVHDEDLEQEAMLRAVEAARKQVHVRHPKAFLMKIVRDAVRDHWRRRRLAEDLQECDALPFAELPRLEDEIDRGRQKELLRKALRALEHDKRVMLELFYYGELSLAEIARIQNKSLSAVKMQLVRARQRLAGIVRRLANKKSQ